MGVEIAKQIKDGANIIELYFPTGRKHSDKSWHTYIGREACEALRRWFEIRGYPTKEDPYIWPSIGPQGRGDPLTDRACRPLHPNSRKARDASKTR